MKRIFSVVLVVALMVSLTSAFAKPATEPAGQVKVLIQYKKGKDKQASDDIKGKVKTKIAEKKGKLSREYTNFPLVAATISSASLADLKSDPDVLTVELDSEVQITAQANDWGIDVVGAPTAWGSGVTGAGVKVGVIDTGIATHPDLAVVGGKSFVSYTTSYEDDEGHGTHVAGIIAAKNNDIGYVGVAPDASLYALKALDNYGSGYWSSIISAIDWAVTNDLDIVNMSLGGQSGLSSLETAINTAVSNGTLVLAAAGNDGTSAGDTDSVDFPARYANAIAVGSITSSLVRSSFSSTGPAVDVAAPGSSIKSTYLNGGYATLSGTSMATPYAAGTLALIKQANPTATTSQLRNILQSTAKDLGVAGVDTWYGYGLVQAPSAPPAPDTTAPSIPTGLSASNVTTSGLTLSWSASTDNVGVTGYQVFRDGTLLGSTNATTRTYNVTGLASGTTYNFTIEAFDAAGNYSADSNPLSVTTVTPDTTAPSVPTGLSSSNVTQTSLTLNWLASTDNVGVTGYQVFRNGTLLGSVNGSTRTFNVTGLTAATSYSFTVKAFDAAGNYSANSTPLSVTTAQAPALIATTTTVKMSRTSYSVGSTPSGTVSVRTSTGAAVANAAVQVVVTPPAGTNITLNGRTNSRGDFSFKFSTTNSSAKGTYNVSATSSLTGYVTSTGTTTFTLK